MSISNPRKMSGLQTLNLFPSFYSEKSWVYTINLKKIQVPKQKNRFVEPEIILGFEIDLDFQKSGCRLKDQVMPK